jgi:hypothetical protein
MKCHVKLAIKPDVAAVDVRTVCISDATATIVQGVMSVAHLHHVRVYLLHPCPNERETRVTRSLRGTANVL